MIAAKDMIQEDKVEMILSTVESPLMQKRILSYGDLIPKKLVTLICRTTDRTLERWAYRYNIQRIKLDNGTVFYHIDEIVRMLLLRGEGQRMPRVELMYGYTAIDLIGRTTSQLSQIR